MHFEPLDIALIAGVPAAIVLLLAIAFPLARHLQRKRVTFGPLSGVAIIVVVLTLSSALTISRPARPPSFLFLLYGGIFVASMAGRMRSPTLRRILPWLGGTIQFGAIAASLYLLARNGALEGWGAYIAPAILAAVCLFVLFGPAKRPAWRTVGIPIVIGVTLAVIVTFATGAQWLMSLLWLGLASGPLAVAWLRANAATESISNTTPPPAMEPTA